MNESISWFQFIRLLSSLMSACSSVNPRCLITSQVNSWWWPWNCLLLVWLFLPSETIPVWSVGSVAGMENSCPSRRIHPEPLFSALLFPSALFLDCHTYSFFYDSVYTSRRRWVGILCYECSATLVLSRVAEFHLHSYLGTVLWKMLPFPQSCKCWRCHFKDKVIMHMDCRELV